MKTAQSSPLRRVGSDGRRPQSSGGGEPFKKGLGVKDMEQTLDTMHKQMFDLKLELYHRRERQTQLDAKVQKLEAEQAKTAELNDRLVLELEKRDQAVQEAVTVIVLLEAKVEQLMREREMVRHVDNEGYSFYPREGTPTPSALEIGTPQRKDSFLSLFPSPSRAHDTKLSRQPSFLSDCSAATSNLRNVYLGVRGSVISLPKMDGPDLERGETRSPSMSVLSESSFLSVYGQKGINLSSSVSEYKYDGTSFDAYVDSSPLEHKSVGNKSTIVTPSKLPRQSDSPNLHKGTPKLHNITDILGGESPLQKLENLDKTMAYKNDEATLATHERPDGHMPAGWRADQAGQPKTKQEKRDALHQVMTNGPSTKNFANPNGLPPTPDTISTGTLRRFESSNDNIHNGQGQGPERSYLTVSDNTTSDVSLPALPKDKAGNSSKPSNGLAQPVSTTAFDSRKELPRSNSYYDNDHSSHDHIQRPRSADETTVSNRREDGRRAEWNSDESDEDLDYWMQESRKPDQVKGLTPLSSASQAGNPNKGRVSPDLFSFPTSTRGWATNAMFGTLSGSGYNGAGGSLGAASSPLANTLDALGDSLPQPLFDSGLASPILDGTVAPPPPNRRSSLNARTGSSHGTMSHSTSTSSNASPAVARIRKSQDRNRNRSNSVDGPPMSAQKNARAAAAHVGRAPTAPPQQSMVEQQVQKQRHYPPTASQPSRSRAFKNLFRRSVGSPADIQAPASTLPLDATSKDIKDVPAEIGVPSWGRRRSGHDIFGVDRDSATPPPIMRHRRESYEGGAPLDENMPVVDHLRQNVQVSNDVVQSSGGAPIKNEEKEAGGKRKWLGLGRRGSLRTRAG
ncbi:hypothetical protein DL546_004393 [Coniochaeta pulveracea]|uniref:Centrosomin N-terminal motif 1 domain-containing protein n=1 Tax=Coniochaeta pulveracea TaxID=177199 RepID=A0A420Y674_9PEZI|nr:hypothetical protein DL546_004393 [Coniochaeta pulveracea]